MKLFSSYTYTWWQVGIFKFAMLSMGVMIGAYWHEVFGSNLEALALLWFASTAYILAVSFRQKK